MLALQAGILLCARLIAPNFVEFARFPADKYKKQGEITMRFSEFSPPASAAQNRQPRQQQKRQPAALEPTDVTRGRMRRELAKKIAQSQAQVQPTGDDLAIAFTRACQARNAVDDAAQQNGDYRAKRFKG